MNSESNNRNKILIITIFVFFIFSLFIFVVLIILGLIYFSNSSQTHETKTYHYQLAKIDPYEDTTEFSFATLPQPLPTEEYISYVDEESGSTFIIVNYGGTKYECSGTCYCDKDQSNTRRSTHVLSRGIMILLSAFSASMAMKVAQETFENHCAQKFSDVCESPYIISDTDDCKESDGPIVTTVGSTTIVKENEDGETGSSPYDELEGNEKNRYLCNGHCVGYSDASDKQFENALPGIKRNEYLKIGFDKIGICEAMELEQVITVTPEMWEKAKAMFEKKCQKTEMVLVRGAFRGLHLHPFCEKQSLLKSEWFSEDSQSELEQAVIAAQSEDPENPFRHYPAVVKKMGEWLEARPFCFANLYFGTNDFGALQENVECVKQN